MRLIVQICHYPPSRDLSGSLRWHFMARHLQSMGVTIDILCLKEPRQDYRADTPNIHRVPGPLYLRSPFYVTPYFWTFHSRPKLNELLRQGTCDACVFSGPPFFYFLNARYVKRRFPHVETIVDFRDAWSCNPYIHTLSLPSRILERLIFPRIEMVCLESVDRAVFSTPMMQRQYEKKYPLLTNKSQVVPNGYDEEKIASVERQSTFGRNERFTIAYIGSLNKKRSPDTLFTALSRMQDIPWKMRVAGPDATWWRTNAKRHGIEHRLENLGRLDYASAVKRAFESDLLLLMQAPTRHPCNPVAAKTYDYLRTGKPLLVMAPLGENRDLVTRLSPCSYTVDNSDVDGCAGAVRSAFERWREGKTGRYVHPDLYRFSRKEIARRFFESMVKTGKAES